MVTPPSIPTVPPRRSRATRATPIALFLAALLPLHARGAPQAPDPAPAASPSAGPAVAWMTVEIWPEYDDPRVLVIYRGTLASSETTPTDFSFVVPRGAQIHMAGGIGPDGAHIHGDFDTEQREEGLVEVSYRLDVPDFYMEFYYDPLTGGEDRSFTYPVVSPSHVATLAVSVQEPLRAQGFEVSPRAEEVVRDDRGFAYHVLRRSEVAAGTSSPVAITYRKNDREPSVASGDGSAESSSPGGGWTLPGGEEMGDLLAILAILLAAATTYILVFRWQRAAPADPASDAMRSAGESPVPPSPTSRSVPRFCSQCGNDIALRDRYCAWCGSETHGTSIRVAARETPASSG